MVVLRLFHSLGCGAEARSVFGDMGEQIGRRLFCGLVDGRKLARFERCPLSKTQRANLDTDLKAAMSKVGVAPITKETVQKEVGAGSATK